MLKLHFQQVAEIGQRANEMLVFPESFAPAVEGGSEVLHLVRPDQHVGLVSAAFGALSTVLPLAQGEGSLEVQLSLLELLGFLLL